MTWDELCDMLVYLVKFLNYEGGERDVEQGSVEIEIENYADIKEKIKNDGVYHSYIFVKDPTTSRPVILSAENFGSVQKNDTLYAYFDILHPTNKKEAFVVRSVSYDSGHRYTENDIVIHHGSYEDLKNKIKFHGREPDATFIVNRQYQVVELERGNYNNIAPRDEIYTHFRMKGNIQCGSQLSSIDTRLAGIHINL